MELRHLRYFLAVAEALSFTKAATQLRIAQPALSRRVQDLEEEIGVDLLKRSPRGVTLTAEGKLFLDEVRELLKRADESVEKVRALARGEYGELHVGYAPSPTVEVLPPALAAFQKAVPRVKVLLHDLSSDELIAGLQNGTLEFAIMVPPADDQTAGIQFEVLRTYPLCVAMTAMHPFTRMKSIPLEKLAAGRGIALATPVLKLVTGKRLLYRPLTGTTEVLSVGIARATKGDVTPAGEKFCELLRKISNGTSAAKPKPARS